MTVRSRGSFRNRPALRRIPSLNAAQVAASDPDCHIWLRAAPGTGKRVVVAARILRLLLMGVSPDMILCLTPDSTDATLISNSVMTRIATWVRAAEVDLAADLIALGIICSPELLARARMLFAIVLDSPAGGLRIQTFEDFAFGLLANYPFEAGLVPAFRALGSVEQAVLSRRVSADLNMLAAEEGRSELSDAIKLLVRRLGPGDTATYLRECARQANGMAALPALIAPWLSSVIAQSGDNADARAAFAGIATQALEAGREYARLYAEAKRRSGACDPGELLYGALSLLEHPAIGEWTRFQVDQGTHHVLVSDAQDTDWRHWRLVRAIADEFFAGEGAHRVPRTLFVCGDPASAVAGSNPIFLEAAFLHFDRLARAAEASGESYGSMDALPLATWTLDRNYRSAQPLVDFIQAAVRMLDEPGVRAAYWQDSLAAGTSAPGEVILLPLHQSDGAGSPVSDAAEFQAARIASLVQGWLGSDRVLASTGRPMRPEDLAILFKRRGRLALQVVARLRAAGIPVLEERELEERHPLPVAALLDLARFALNQDDQQALSSLLCSPLGYMAGHAKDQTPTPGSVAVSNERMRESGVDPAMFGELAHLARHATPYRFFIEVLSGDWGAFGKLIEVWGSVAANQIEVVVDAALEFEQANVPSLGAFLKWFDEIEGGAETNRTGACTAVRVVRCESARDRHFPVVIIADGSECPPSGYPRFFHYPLEQSELVVPILFPDTLEAEADASLAGHCAAAVQRASDEDWRLFYVSATSAVDRLVIAGAQATGCEDVDVASWYRLCERTFDALGIVGLPGEIRIFPGLGPATAARTTGKRTGQGAPLRVDVPA